MKKDEKREQEIMSLYGKLSFALIAKKVGVTRNVVAGVVFRHRHPYSARISSPDGVHNKIGGGHHGHGVYAKKCLPGTHGYRGVA